MEKPSDGNKNFSERGTENSRIKQSEEHQR